MSYKILIKKSAEDELDVMKNRAFNVIVDDHLEDLRDNPRPYRAKKIPGCNAYRIIMGDYRIVYTVDDASKTVELISAAMLREVYR